MNVHPRPIARVRRRPAWVRAVVIGAAVAVACTACGTRLNSEQVHAATAVTFSNVPGGAVAGAPTANTSTGPGGVTVSGGTSAPGATISGGATLGAGSPSSGASNGGGSGGGGSNGGGSGGGAATGPATGSTVYLGNIGTYSGVIGATTTGFQTMLQVWTKYTNAHGGLNGHVVQIISQDDGGDPSVALTDAKQMVANYHILAFFDPFTLFSFTPLTQYAASVGVPIIGGDGTAAAWGDTKLVFPSTASSAAEVNAGNGFFRKAGVKKIGAVYCVEVASLCTPIDADIKAQAASAGLSVVYSAPASLTAPSFTSQCLGAKSAGVQGMWLVMDGASVQRFYRDCSAQGYHPKLSLFGIALPSTVGKDPTLAGSIIPAQTFPPAYDGSPAAQVFHQAVAQYAPSLVNSLTTDATNVWVTGAIVSYAAKKLSAKPTSAELISGLYTISNNSFGGLSAPLTFRPGSTPQGKCAFIEGIGSSNYTAPEGDQLIC